MANYLSHVIRLRPTPDQQVLFKKCVGTARFAYNYAISEWRANGEARKADATLRSISEQDIRKQLNRLKGETYPWMYEVSKTVVQQAIKDAGTSIQRFYKKQSGYPKFHRKGIHDSARLDNGPGTFQFDGKRIRLPKIGWIKMREPLRFDGRPLSAVISRSGAAWYVSVQVEVTDAEFYKDRVAEGVIGVDLGVKTAVVCSDGTCIDSPKPLKRHLKRLKRQHRVVSRRKKGSNRRRKAVAKLAKLHERVGNIRKDWLHKTTTKLVCENQAIGIEDLNVAGMLKNHKLARAISDVGFGEFRRQLEYKTLRYDTQLVMYPRFEPSSKKCSVCGRVLDELPLSVREWTCDSCGEHHDRDLNAAIVIAKYTNDRLVLC